MPCLTKKPTLHYKAHVKLRHLKLILIFTYLDNRLEDIYAAPNASNDFSYIISY
jgi:hypothetical protein